MQPPVAITHLLLLGSLSRMAVICQLHPATWQGSCLSQRETLLAPHRATDSTVIIQGRMSRWPSHSGTLVWQLSPNPQRLRQAAQQGPAKETREGVSEPGAAGGSQARLLLF